MKLTIGITGIGGDIGLGILNALKESRYKNARLIGIDVNPYSIGLYKANKGYIAPKAESKAYVSKLIKICKKEKIRALFISTEQELSVLSENREIFEKKTKTKLIIADRNVIDIGSDKWKTHQFLKNNNLPYPRSILLNNIKETRGFIKKLGYPLIIKPRNGRGAKNLYLVKDFRNFEFYRKKVKEPILQEYLKPSDQEYTCGVFAFSDKIFTIIFKRELNFGLTTKAMVIKDKEIEDVCQKIAKKINLQGPANIQLRKTKRGVVPFEINPRYSSTVSIRNHLGFRDVEWAIDFFIFKKNDIKYRPPKKGLIILRYFGDFYLKKAIKPSAKFFNL